VLGYLFTGVPSGLECLSAADADDNDVLDISDGISILSYLFQGGSPPPPPYGVCGPDPTPGVLGCAGFQGCSGPPGALHANVRIVDREGATPMDPVLVDLDAATTTLLDPPGGIDVDPGDVIAGAIPPGSPAAVHGLAYMRRVTRVRSVSGSTKVLETRGATLRDVFREAFFSTGGGLASLSGGEALEEPLDPVRFCPRAGGGGERGAGAGRLIDFNRDGELLVDLRSGDSYFKAGFKQAHVLLDAGLILDYGVDFDDGLYLLKVFAGIELDVALELYIDGKWSGILSTERQVYRHQKSQVIIVLGVPIQFTMTATLFAGIRGPANGRVQGALGAFANWRGGAGFLLDHGDLKNLSGIAEPGLGLLPDPPVFEMEGSAVLDAYVRPELSLKAGLPLDALTADLVVSPDMFIQTRISGQLDVSFLTGTNLCIDYGFDAGFQLSLSPELQLFGYDLFDETYVLIPRKTFPIASGRIGCAREMARPIASFNGMRLIPREFGVFDVMEFDAGLSTDPDGGPLEFRWDSDADGICDADTGTSPIATTLVPKGTAARTRLCRVRVIDDERTFGESGIQYPPQDPD